MEVSVKPPRTPVTEGSSGMATATVPNVCKMPGPPAPFVPTPLPNIGKSGSSPKGFSSTVKIEGKAVAIKGASFTSMGDVASKGTGGGIVSMNTEGPTTFAGPGALDVKIDGKNVQLLGDPTLNNNGPSGNPPNASAVAVMQGTLVVAPLSEEECAALKAKFGIQTGSHKENTSGKTKKTSRSYQSHHIFQDAAMKALCPRPDACAVMLANSHRGTEHGDITSNQNSRKNNKRGGGGPVPGTTFGDIKKQARDDMVKGLEGKRADKDGKPMTKQEAEQAADCIVAEAEATAKKAAKRQKKELDDSTPVAQPGGCFSAGTLIQLATGALCAVEALEQGMEVRTTTGRSEVLRVETCYHALVHIEVAGTTLSVAAYHRFVDDEGRLVRADELCVGDRVRTASSLAVIKDVVRSPASVQIYRFGLARDEICLLGALGVLTDVPVAGPPLAPAISVEPFDATLSEGAV